GPTRSGPRVRVHAFGSTCSRVHRAGDASRENAAPADSPTARSVSELDAGVAPARRAANIARMPMRGSLLCGTLLAVLPCAAAQDRQEYLGDPIRYEDPTQHDPVGALRRRLSEGSTTLDRDPELGLLPALLEALDVPVSSQTLVFSKTSFQSDL